MRLRISNGRVYGVDLSRINLSKANLREANFSAVVLDHANFRGAQLWGTVLVEAYLAGADLRETDIENIDESLFLVNNLSRANLNRVDLNSIVFRDTDLSGANLSRTNILGTHFVETDLSETNFNRATVSNTYFTKVDLSRAKGLETLEYGGPSSIGIDTIIRSQGKIPEFFFRGIGVPPSIIEAIPTLIGSLKPIDFYSCFISYSSKDKDFAERLYADLQAKGVRC